MAAESSAARRARVGQGGKPLVDAVRAFNEQFKVHAIGKNQPLLTVEEVNASIRLALVNGDLTNIEQRDMDELCVIAEYNTVADGWQFEILTGFRSQEGTRVQAWSIRLTRTHPDGTGYTHEIRNQLLRHLEVRALTQEEVTNLKQRGEALKERYQAGEVDFDSIARTLASDVLEAELQLALSAKERVAILERQAALLQDLERALTTLYKTGKCGVEDILGVRADRAEVEKRLAAERAASIAIFRSEPTDVTSPQE